MDFNKDLNMNSKPVPRFEMTVGCHPETAQWHWRCWAFVRAPAPMPARCKFHWNCWRHVLIHFRSFHQLVTRVSTGFLWDESTPDEGETTHTYRVTLTDQLRIIEVKPQLTSWIIMDLSSAYTRCTNGNLDTWGCRDVIIYANYRFECSSNIMFMFIIIVRCSIKYFGTRLFL